MNKIKIAFISNTFVWSCAICWKKFKNHAISPRITHFLLLTGFGDFPRGSETVSAGFRRLFHGVHGCLAFPPSCYNICLTVETKENRIYIRGEFTRKKCKTAILLYCFHTAGVLHIFMLYNLLGPGISFYRKSKIIVKRKPNYEIGWFHNWPMIISHRLYAFHFTNDDFPL